MHFNFDLLLPVVCVRGTPGIEQGMSDTAMYGRPERQHWD